MCWLKVIGLYSQTCVKGHLRLEDAYCKGTPHGPPKAIFFYYNVTLLRGHLSYVDKGH